MPKITPFDEYTKIYHEYHVLNLSVWEIAQKHHCSDDKVRDAINYIDKNLNTEKTPIQSLLNGAYLSIRERLKNNKHELNNLQKKKEKNYPIIIAFNREIRADEQLLYKLQGLLESEMIKKGSEPSNIAGHYPEVSKWLAKQCIEHIKENSEDVTSIEELVSTLEKNAL